MNDNPSPPATGMTVQDRSTEFVPVTGGRDTTSAEALLLTAYILMWALVFGFVWLSVRRQRQMDARLSDIEQALHRLDAPSTGHGASPTV